MRHALMVVIRENYLDSMRAVFSIFLQRTERQAQKKEKINVVGIDLSVTVIPTSQKAWYQ